jgi:hypothetical protein
MNHCGDEFMENFPKEKIQLRTNISTLKQSSNQKLLGIIRMLLRVALQEVIFAAIAAELELGPDTKRRSRIASFPNRLLGPRQVAFEIHRPLVQTARCQLHHPHLA